MGALAPPASSWRPEDDVLLTKAIEDGASLKSLAKGAVKFSRKFTFEEIQERWRSLLYDPVVSVDAAFCMIEFDHLSPCFLSQQKRPRATGEINGFVAKRRRIQSVRNCYYTLKKQISNESSNSIGLGFLVEPGELSYDGNGDHPSGSLDLQVSDPCHFELEESDLDILRHGFGQIVDDSIAHQCPLQFAASAQEMLPIDQSNDLVEPCNLIPSSHANNKIEGEMEKVQTKEMEELCSIFHDNNDFTTSIFYHESPGHDMQCLDSADMGLWSSSPGAVDLVRQTNLYSDSKDVLMAELSELSSTLLNFTNDEELLLLDERKDAISTYDFEALLLSSPIHVSPEGNIVEHQVLNHADKVDHSIEIEISTSSQFPKQSDEVVSCVLNTEDMEIPCNDDIVFSTKTGFSRISSSVKMESGLHHPDDASAPYEMDGTSKETSERHTSSIFNGYTSEIYSGLKHDLDDSDRSYDLVTSWRTNTPVVTMVEEDSAIESDDDVPHYSDIEAMVLDMDLDPDNHDLFSSKEAFTYQFEETKILIMRMEQIAHSYLRRSIAFHGAFAVLYGRHSKHYIKKSEVVLGRRTEGVKVDIDLGMEGSSCKISRRQAVINLDKSGVFRIKNLGKRRIGVNDKQIATGESICLTNSCLIEVRGVPFIFETYQRLVQQYLDSVTERVHSRNSIVKHLVKLR